jgi:hypothetical protein
MAVVTQIQVRRGTASQWTSANPTLAAGEWGYETDTGLTKIGNGSTAWASLAYATGSIAVGNITGLGTGVATFLATPTSSNLATAVSDETGSGSLVFGTNPTLTSPLINIGVNTQTGTTYTPVLSDNGKIVTLNNASAITVSIPTNATTAFPTGAQITFAWITGAGQPTIQAASSGTTTILSTGATATAPKLRVVNSTATAVKLATDSWIVMGDIA